MKNSVLNSYAVLASLFEEKGYGKVLDLFEKAAQADQSVLIAASNWAEVRYIVERKVGAARWHEARHKLLGLPLDVVPSDQSLSELAGVNGGPMGDVANAVKSQPARRMRTYNTCNGRVPFRGTPLLSFAAFPPAPPPSSQKGQCRL